MTLRAEITSWASVPALSKAWHRVRRNRGMAGADGVSVAGFAGLGAPALAQLSADLTTGTYRPVRLWRVRKVKPCGGHRVLAVPAVRDRIAQAACAAALSTAIEPLMSRASFAYRPGLSVEAAAGRVAMLRLQGWTWAVHLDIQACFDSVPHKPLVRALRPAVCAQTLSVIGRWLCQVSWRGPGIAQGSPLSPVLLNWYLTPFDHAMNRGQVRLVRYADDMLLLARGADTLARATQRAGHALADLGLVMNPDKTRMAWLDDGQTFLGLRFDATGIRRVSAGPPGG